MLTICIRRCRSCSATTCVGGTYDGFGSNGMSDGLSLSAVSWSAKAVYLFFSM